MLLAAAQRHDPDSYGFYRWRDRCFFDRGSAVQAAGGQEIAFDFHDAHWLTIDTTVEPSESLDELYRQRAQNLRDRFDYLILMYSGGADSHQVMMSFLKNGIFLNEVRVILPFGQINVEAASSELDLLKEYREQIVPGLQLLHYLSPGTKITTVDLSHAYTGRWTEEWLETLCLWPKPHGALFNAIWRNAETADLQRYVDQLNRSTAVIYGADKPCLKLQGNDAYFYFSDISRDGMYNFFGDGQPLFTPIMFYWGAPRVVLKQAHVIKQALMRTPRALAYVRATEHQQVFLGRNIPVIDLSLIYSDWRHQRWTKVTNDNTNIITALIERPAMEFTKLRNQQWADLLGARPALNSPLHYLGRIDDNPTLPAFDRATWRQPVYGSGPGGCA